MYYVYILRNLKISNKTYIGFSANLRERLKYHNSGQSPHTNRFKPWKIETCINFPNEQRARDFEKYLKTSSEIAFRRKRL